MKTTKEERQNCRAIISRKYPADADKFEGTVVYTYDYRLWSFLGRLLDDIENLLAENKRLCTLLEDVENARLEEAELLTWGSEKEGK